MSSSEIANRVLPGDINSLNRFINNVRYFYNY